MPPATILFSDKERGKVVDHRSSKNNAGFYFCIYTVPFHFMSFIFSATKRAKAIYTIPGKRNIQGNSSRYYLDSSKPCRRV